MAEKNIAYLVREDTKTIGVRFYKEVHPNDVKGFQSVGNIDEIFSDTSPKEYVYVTNIDFKIGDLAVVKAAGSIKVAVVSRVDDCCQIEPNECIKYSWVIDKVNVDEYEKQLDINKELEATVNKAYKQNVKNQFRQLVLSSIDTEAAAKINTLLGVTPK